MKIIGIKPYEEALKIKEEEVKQDKIDNRKNILRSCITIPLGLIISTGIILLLFACFEGFDGLLTTWHAPKIILMIGAGTASTIVAVTSGDYTPKLERYDYTPVWQYADIAKDYNILKRTLKYNDWNNWWELELDLEDKRTKSVSYATIKPFWSTTKTDVNDYVVDLEHNKLIKPYCNEKCNLSETITTVGGGKPISKTEKAKQGNIMISELTKSGK